MMKKLSVLFFAVLSVFLISTRVSGQNSIVNTSKEALQNHAFTDLFTQIDPKNVSENVFKLVGSDFSVITAGDPSRYNSMVASWGGWGILLEKPTTWCFLRSNRYTLEIIREKQTYTMTYFDDEYKKEIIKFGQKSGRDSDKMKESSLSVIQTPSGNMTYREAKLIIECKLTEVTTVSPDDFYSDNGRKFVLDAYAETNNYHKIVFGEITNMWVRK